MNITYMKDEEVSSISAGSGGLAKVSLEREVLLGPVVSVTISLYGGRLDGTAIIVTPSEGVTMA